MNNKGFTLIEALAVLVILSFIMGLALPAFTSSLEKSKKREKEIREEKIMAAAEMYVADHKFNEINDFSGNEYFISVKKLIESGYLSSGEIKDIKDGEGGTYKKDTHSIIK